jgi:hypothetical protein
MLVCTCVYSFSSRTVKPNWTKPGVLIPWDQKDILERSKLRKIILSSGPAEDIPVDGKPSTLEQRHNQRSLFRRNYRNEGHNYETFLDSSRGKDCVGSSETKHSICRHQNETALFLRDQRNKCQNLEKFTSIEVPLKIISVARKRSTIKNDAMITVVLVRRFHNSGHIHQNGISENKHNKKTAPWPELFVSAVERL